MDKIENHKFCKDCRFYENEIPKTFAGIEKCVRTDKELLEIIETYKRDNIGFCVCYKGDKIISVMRE